MAGHRAGSLLLESAHCTEPGGDLAYRLEAGITVAGQRRVLTGLRSLIGAGSLRHDSARCEHVRVRCSPMGNADGIQQRDQCILDLSGVVDLDD